MKLQNLIIIFIIITIPIILIFSFYLNLQTKTITLQTDYDTKLIEATKEAVEAFEINTVEWNSQYSTLANSKRQDIMSSINVFTTGLANKLGIGGTSKENILSYVPAIVYTMYDGYYIYSPTHVPQTITDDNGVQLFYYADAGSENAKFTISATQNIKGTNVAGEPMYIYDAEKGGPATGTYNDITFTTNADYAKKTYKHVLKTFVPYTTTYKNHVINYTLDNYIRVYCEDGEAKEGYIIDLDKIRFSNQIIYYNNQRIMQETLYENIAIKNDSGQIKVQEYMYIYNSNNDKRYYDPDVDKFFTVSKKCEKVYLRYSLAEYKKILVKKNDGYMEAYQLLNKNTNNWEYIDENGNYIPVPEVGVTVARYEDVSAFNYYMENYFFNKWLKTQFSDAEIKEIVDNKIQNIIDNINQNLNLSISNYSANSGENYKLPEISTKDWEQALSNISMITFFQGSKVGLKTYNNYAIVTSTENNEYIDEESLYFIDEGSNKDNYYHRHKCNSITDVLPNYCAYRNTEFKVQSYTYNDSTIYYYKHTNKNNECVACFDCIVNRNNMQENKEYASDFEYYYNTAIAREKYIQMQKTKLTK